MEAQVQHIRVGKLTEDTAMEIDKEPPTAPNLVSQLVADAVSLKTKSLEKKIEKLMQQQKRQPRNAKATKPAKNKIRGASPTRASSLKKSSGSRQKTKKAGRKKATALADASANDSSDASTAKKVHWKKPKTKASRGRKK